MIGTEKSRQFTKNNSITEGFQSSLLAVNHGTSWELAVLRNPFSLSGAPVRT